MTALLKTLESKLEGFKTVYLSKIETYSKNMFEYHTKVKSWKGEDWYNHFGLSTDPDKMKESRYRMYHTAIARKRARMSSMAHRVVRKGYDKFLEDCLKNAEDHFKTSLEKLVYRIEGKGLDLENLDIEVESLDVNLNVRISDGKKQVRAFTIIAEGPIQKPHYRYLIK